MKGIRPLSHAITLAWLCLSASLCADTDHEARLRRHDRVKAHGSATIYESSRDDGTCLKPRKVGFESVCPVGLPIVRINPGKRYQTIIGFGGAFTDAAIDNLGMMNRQNQAKILKAYFGPTGNNYSLGRVPIGSCDFSDTFYSYCDQKDDFLLKTFKLNHFDFKRIRFIKRANKLRGHPLTLFASPWSAPPWMKTNNRYAHGSLKKDDHDRYRNAWALYCSQFISAYRKPGIRLWAVTVQNEPHAPSTWIGRLFLNWESMVYDSKGEREFIAKFLGPKLARHNPGVRILMMDDAKGNLPEWADDVLKDPTAGKYVYGIGVHWYDFWGDGHFDNLVKTSRAFPKQVILATEACEGWKKLVDSGPARTRLQQWARGENYAHDICGDLKGGVAGWTDWNLVLDMRGGPNHLHNYCDAPILVDPQTQKVLTQPMYYAMGHFSRFIPPESRRIETDVTGARRVSVMYSSAKRPHAPQTIETVSFKTPPNKIVTFVLNRKDRPFSYCIHDPNRGWLTIAMPAHAMQTIVYATSS